MSLKNFKLLTRSDYCSVFSLSTRRKINSGEERQRTDKLIRNCASVAQSCLTLSDPMNCSPPVFSAHRILQARTLEWAAIFPSRGSSWLRDQTWVSCTVNRFFSVWAARKAPIRNYYSANFPEWLKDSSTGDR